MLVIHDYNSPSSLEPKTDFQTSKNCRSPGRSGFSVVRNRVVHSYVNIACSRFMLQYTTCNFSYSLSVTVVNLFMNKKLQILMSVSYNWVEATQSQGCYKRNVRSMKIKCFHYQFSFPHWMLSRKSLSIEVFLETSSF